MPPPLPGGGSLLLLRAPACEWLGAGAQKAIVLWGAPHDGSFDHPEGKMTGRGMHALFRKGRPGGAPASGPLCHPAQGSVGLSRPNAGV